MTDWVKVYSDGVDAVADVVTGLTPAQLTTVVPATPEWTVEQLLAHLAGTAADVTTGQVDGAPGDAWTARQVNERRDAETSELLAELRGTRPAMTEIIQANDRPAVVWNLVVHLADLTEALQRPSPPEQLWLPIVEALRPRVPESLAGADDYELFRALFSRRSRDQLAVMAGGSDPALDDVGLFGPRMDAQPIPAR